MPILGMVVSGQYNLLFSFWFHYQMWLISYIHWYYYPYQYLIPPRLPVLQLHSQNLHFMGHVDSPAMISGWHTSYKGYISFPHENSTFYHFSKILLIENKNKNDQLSKITMDGYLIH